MDSTLTELQDVFCQVFGDDSIVLRDSTTAAEIDGWDSMMHINLMIAIEKRFGVKFAAAEIGGLKADGQDVGALVRLLERKRAGAGADRR
jgi:acyl carrier protein